MTIAVCSWLCGTGAGNGWGRCGCAGAGIALGMAERGGALFAAAVFSGRATGFADAAGGSWGFCCV